MLKNLKNAWLAILVLGAPLTGIVQTAHAQSASPAIEIIEKDGLETMGTFAGDINWSLTYTEHGRYTETAMSYTISAPMVIAVCERMADNIISATNPSYYKTKVICANTRTGQVRIITAR